MPMEVLAPTPHNVARAAERLRAGGLVGMPTETVYGLAAAARNEAAVASVFDLKGRPHDHPLIVHLASAAQLLDWGVPLDERAGVLADALWPGPLTLVVPRAKGVPDSVTGGQPTIALRVPSHPVALDLLKAFGGGVAAPSANRFGRLSPTSADHVAAEFGSEDLLVLDGGVCTIGLESTIVDLTGPATRLLRPGAVSREELEAVLGRCVELPPTARPGMPRVPGSHASHYAPGAPTELVTSDDLNKMKGAGLTVLARQEAPPSWGGAWQRLPDDAAAYAAGLYAALRRLDATHPAAIIIERVPERPEWLAVRDRLERASAPRPMAAQPRRSA